MLWISASINTIDAAKGRSGNISFMWEVIVDRVDFSSVGNIILLAFLRRLFLKISSMIMMIEVAVLVLSISEKRRKMGSMILVSGSVKNSSRNIGVVFWAY